MNRDVTHCYPRLIPCHSHYATRRQWPYVRLCHVVPLPGPAKEGLLPCSQVSLPAGRGHHHTRPPSQLAASSQSSFPACSGGGRLLPSKGVSAAAVYWPASLSSARALTASAAGLAGPQTVAPQGTAGTPGGILILLSAGHSRPLSHSPHDWITIPGADFSADAALLFLTRADSLVWWGLLGVVPLLGWRCWLVSQGGFSLVLRLAQKVGGLSHQRHTLCRHSKVLALGQEDILHLGPPSAQPFHPFFRTVPFLATLAGSGAPNTDVRDGAMERHFSLAQHRCSDLQGP